MLAGIGRRWLEGGAGDGNRKYRWRAPAFWNHEVANAKGAACDFCAKNAAIGANCSQGDHWGEHRLGSHEKATRSQFSLQVRVSRERARDRLCGLLAIVGQLSGETDAAARRVSWAHEFADCREDRGDGFVMLRELAIQA